MDVMTVSDAAKRLGVSPRQAQRLAASGSLARAAGTTVTSQSVVNLMTLRPERSHLTRSWSAPTAWAALALLSGRDDLARGIGQAQLSRLRGRLRDATPESLAASLRARAQVYHYEAHPSTLERLRSHVTDPAATHHAGNLTPRPATHLDGYVTASELPRLVKDHALTPAMGPATVTLRATDYDHVQVIAEAGIALAGSDLASSSDPRERAEGLRLLADALRGFSR